MFRINRLEEKDRSYLNSCKFQEIFTWIDFIILFNHCNMVEMNILILQIKKKNQKSESFRILTKDTQLAGKGMRRKLQSV